MAECRRIAPNHVGPDCGCSGDACALDAPRPTSQLAADVAIPGTVQFLTEYADRLEGVKGYPVHAQEIRKLLAHADALVARITDLETQLADAAEHLGDLVQFGEATARARAAEAQVEKRENDARTAMGAAERFREQGIKDAERAEAAEAQVAALTESLAAANRDYGARLDEAEAQVAALTAQLENEAAGVDVALQNARLLNIVRDLEAQVAALTAQVGAASDREAGLSDALDDVRERLAALTQERDEWRDRAGKGHATALDMLATTRQALTEVSERQPKTIDWLRANGIVFDGPLGIDPGNWEHVAFSIYNDLCEADDIARRALAATDTTDV